MRTLNKHFFLTVFGLFCWLAFGNETMGQTPLILQDLNFSECRRSVEARASGGLAPYTYQWSFEGEIVQIDNNLSSSQFSLLTRAQPGVYTLIITDNGGRALTRNIPFVGTSNFTLDIEISEIFQCANETSANITGIIEGGLPPYTIRFFDLNENLVRTVNNFPGGPLNLTGIPAGQYVVEVEDALLCIELTEIDIPEIDPIILEPATGVGTFPETCAANGGISFNAQGFTGEVRFRIRRANGTYVNGWTVAPGGLIQYNQLVAGNYVLEIIDFYRNETCPAELDFSDTIPISV
jgi:hypothetical protein